MSNLRDIYRKSIMGLLRPIVKFALIKSIKYRDLSEILKLCFVQVASEELERGNYMLTASKVSVMTGIQRKDITRLLEGNTDKGRDIDIVTRLIGLWRNNPKFLDSQRKPRILDLNAREGDFAVLCNLVSTDLNPYTMLFELERLNLVSQSENGIKLLRSGFEPKGEIEASLKLLYLDSQDLIKSVCENIFEPKAKPNLHVKTHFDKIPRSKEESIREWFLKNGGKFHEEAEKFLSQLDMDINPKLEDLHKDEPVIRVGIGSYSFTESD